MSDIIIKSEEKQEEKPIQDSDIKDTLKQADEYAKLKEENDKMEREFMRQQELKAKIALGGQALAGKPEENEEDKLKQEASKIINMFRS